MLGAIKNEFLKSKEENTQLLALGLFGASTLLIGFGIKECQNNMVDIGMSDVGLGISSLVASIAITKEFILDNKTN